jgi:hypothetical protein
MAENAKISSAGPALFKGLFAVAFVFAVLISGVFSGLWHGAGLYYLVCGTIAAAFIGFSWREIAAAFRFAAGRPRGTVGELKRAAYFWEAAARNAWILGVLGSALNFIIALGRGVGGIGDIANRITQAFVVTLYGLVMAVVCLVPALKIQGRTRGAEPQGPSEAREPGPADFGKIFVLGKILRYAPLAAVLATAGYSLIRANPQGGSLSLDKVILNWPSILVVVGGTTALALFMGAGAVGRALTLGFAMTGLISLLMGFIQALFGFVHHNIQEVTSALVFIISSCSIALLGMLVVGAPLEDREVMEGRREGPAPLSRMFWAVFPLVAYVFLILAFLMVITPMTKPAGG